MSADSDRNSDEAADELEPLAPLWKDATFGEASSSSISWEQQQQQQQQQQQRSASQPQLLQRRSSSLVRSNAKEIWRAQLKIRFRKTARSVMIMISWIRIMLKRKSYNDDEQIKVANSLEGFKTDDSSLSFDPSQFRTKKEIDLTSDMKYTLQLSPSERSQEQLQALLLGLQNLATFNEYPLEIQEKLARVAYYYAVPAGRLIIRQGHIGVNFYIIVSGKALVTVMRNDPGSGETRSSIVARLGQGQAFGEIALLHRVARTASIVSQEHMQLLAIGSDDFKAIFMSAKPGEVPAHIQFLLSLNFMQSFPLEPLLQQPQACLVNFYRRNALIVADSKRHECIVVVRSGSCRVVKRIVVNLSDVPTVASRRNDFKQKLSVGCDKPKIDTGLRKQQQSVLFDVSVSKKRLALNSALGLNQRVVEVSRQAPDFEKIIHQLDASDEQQKKTVAVQICTLKAGDCFGLADVTFKGEKNFEIEDSASVALVSNGAECLLFDKSFFVQNAPTSVQLQVRAEARPYPEESVFQESYYQQVAWENYRRRLLFGTVADINGKRHEA